MRNGKEVVRFGVPWEKTYGTRRLCVLETPSTSPGN